jgi:hypothetical protein
MCRHAHTCIPAPALVHECSPVDLHAEWSACGAHPECTPSLPCFLAPSSLRSFRSPSFAASSRPFGAADSESAATATRGARAAPRVCACMRACVRACVRACATLNPHSATSALPQYKMCVCWLAWHSLPRRTTATLPQLPPLRPPPSPAPVPAATPLPLCRCTGSRSDTMSLRSRAAALPSPRVTRLLCTGTWAAGTPGPVQPRLLSHRHRRAIERQPRLLSRLSPVSLPSLSRLSPVSLRPSTPQVKPLARRDSGGAGAGARRGAKLWPAASAPPPRHRPPPPPLKPPPHLCLAPASPPPHLRLNPPTSTPPRLHLNSP